MKKQRAYGKNKIRPKNAELREAIYTIEKCLQFDNYAEIVDRIEYTINRLKEIQEIIGKGEYQLTPRQQKLKKDLHELRVIYFTSNHSSFGGSFEIDQKAFLELLISTLKTLL
jgi:hypothetical protein